MADNNLRIPRNKYMGYKPDAHVGVGTCIGTMAMGNIKDGMLSASIVGFRYRLRDARTNDAAA